MYKNQSFYSALLVMTLNGILCLDIAAVIVKIKQHIAELYVLFQTTAVKLIYHVFVEIRREIE